MTRSRQRNNFLRFRSEENKKAYNEQHDRCVKLVRNCKKSYYSNLDIKDINDDKKFWKIVTANESITLVDNSNISSSDIEIAES